MFYNRYGEGIRAGQEIETLPSGRGSSSLPDPAQIFKPDPNLPPGVVQTKTQTQILYELFPYDWNYTDDMSHCTRTTTTHDEFESEFIGRYGGAKWKRIARNLRNIEQTGKALDKNFSPRHREERRRTNDTSGTTDQWRNAGFCQAKDAHKIAEDDDV